MDVAVLSAADATVSFGEVAASVVDVAALSVVDVAALNVVDGRLLPRASDIEKLQYYA